MSNLIGGNNIKSYNPNYGSVISNNNKSTSSSNDNKRKNPNYGNDISNNKKDRRNENDNRSNQNLGNGTSNYKNNGGKGNDPGLQNNKDKKVNPTTTTTKYINPPYDANYDAYNNYYLFNNDTPMEEEKEEAYIEEKNQQQCQKEVNIQLLLRRQKHYNNTFRNCYDSMKVYLKNPTNTNKGNFLWNLDGCCSMVSLWKSDYPEYEPQFSKEFKKEEVVKEIQNYIQIFKQKNNIEHVKIFNKFYNLLNNQKQNLEDDKTILNYFPSVKPTEGNVVSTAHNLMGLQRKIDQETEKEEFYGFPNYDVDKKVRHLRNRGVSC